MSKGTLKEICCKLTSCWPFVFLHCELEYIDRYQYDASYANLPHTSYIIYTTISRCLLRRLRALVNYSSDLRIEIELDRRHTDRLARPRPHGSIHRLACARDANELLFFLIKTRGWAWIRCNLINQQLKKIPSAIVPGCFFCSHKPEEFFWRAVGFMQHSHIKGVMDRS